MRVRYSSNNSGGSWWLSDDDWKALERGGWEVKWLSSEWLGAKAKEAYREALSVDVAKAEWAALIGQNPDEEGCRCCGEPHWFSEEA